MVWANSSPADKLIIFFHGNAEDIGTSGGFLNPIMNRWKVILHLLTQKAHAVAVEYPTYGLYEHKDGQSALKKEANFVEDGDLVYNFFKDNLNLTAKQIIIFGRSIGSGPATCLADKHPAGAFFLFSPMFSLRSVASEHAPGCLKCMVSCIIPKMFDNGTKIWRIETPTFIIHGKADTVIDQSNGVKLFENSGCKIENKQLVQPAEMTHNTFDLFADFLPPSVTFLTKIGLLQTSNFAPIESNALLHLLPYDTRKESELNKQKL